MRNPKKKVYIATLNQGHIRTELTQVLMMFQRDDRYDITFDFAADKPISNNRNKIVKRFLDSDCDILMMIDSDIVPTPDTLDLLDYDKDIITPTMFAYRSIGIVPLALERKENVEELTEEQRYNRKALNVAMPQIELDGKTSYNVIGTSDAKDYALEGILEVDATGTGCIAIKREVLEEIPAPFLDKFDQETGERTLGLDLRFCKRAKEKGFRVWVHTDYVASHYTDMDQKQVYKSLMQQSDAGIRIQAVGNRKVER